MWRPNRATTNSRVITRNPGITHRRRSHAITHPDAHRAMAGATTVFRGMTVGAVTVETGAGMTTAVAADVTTVAEAMAVGVAMAAAAIAKAQA